MLDWLELPPTTHQVRLHLFTVPGPLFHDPRREQELRDADAILCVWDSQQARDVSNIESLDELESCLGNQGRHLRNVPLVHQYNKRDLVVRSRENHVAVSEHEANLNEDGRPSFGSVAKDGIGVRETLRALARTLLGSQRHCHVRAPESSDLPSRLASLLGTWREQREREVRSRLSSLTQPSSVDALFSDCYEHGHSLFELGERSGEWLEVRHDEDLTELGTRLSRELGTDSIIAWHQQVPELASFQLWNSGVLRRQLTCSTLDGWLVDRGDRLGFEDVASRADGERPSLGEAELRHACRHLGLELPPSPPAWPLAQHDGPPTPTSETTPMVFSSPPTPRASLMSRLGGWLRRS
ncbi:MAG: GTPase domain-containing protein [Acidobacteriota bacterium]